MEQAGSWELDLYNDVRAVVMRAMDPFARLMLKLTSKANRRQWRALWLNKRRRKSYGIWRLAMTYSTPHVVAWVFENWPAYDAHYCTPRFALEARNFPVASWLLASKGFKHGCLVAFATFLRDRDYTGMDWCYEHGLAVDLQFLLWDGLLVDLGLQAWMEGKNLHLSRPKPVIFRLRPYYPDTIPTWEQIVRLAEYYKIKTSS